MIRIQKTLVPVDFSESSLKAVRYGVEIARDRRARVYFLHVINERIVESIYDLHLKGYKGDFVAACKNMIRDRHEELVQFVPDDLRDWLEVEFEIRKGKPAGEIIKFARDNRLDLIVVGTSGHSALEAALVGSVARHEVDPRRLPCPGRAPHRARLRGLSF